MIIYLQHYLDMIEHKRDLPILRKKLALNTFFVFLIWIFSCQSNKNPKANL